MEKFSARSISVFFLLVNLIIWPFLARHQNHPIFVVALREGNREASEKDEAPSKDLSKAKQQQRTHEKCK